MKEFADGMVVFHNEDVAQSLLAKEKKAPHPGDVTPLTAGADRRIKPGWGLIKSTTPLRMPSQGHSSRSRLAR